MRCASRGLLKRPDTLASPASDRKAVKSLFLSPSGATRSIRASDCSRLMGAMRSTRKLSHARASLKGLDVTTIGQSLKRSRRSAMACAAIPASPGGTSSSPSRKNTSCPQRANSSNVSLAMSSPSRLAVDHRVSMRRTAERSGDASVSHARRRSGRYTGSHVSPWIASSRRCRRRLDLPPPPCPMITMCRERARSPCKVGDSSASGPSSIVRR